MKFFGHLKNMMSILQLPREQRALTFYCENKNYWVHLQPIIEVLLEDPDLPICYITSSDDDPGLAINAPQFRAFKIDEGSIRNHLFKNLDADIMVMTMPDLHRYQVKRSRHSVHYIYIQHSLVSLHSVYRAGAYDHFDTVFCAGPHHINEVQALIRHRNCDSIRTFKHGYGRLDTIAAASAIRGTHKKIGSEKHILVAPSWGQDGLIETIGMDVVTVLMESGYRVTLRPHPQTTKISKDKVMSIVSKYSGHEKFLFENSVSGQESLFDSDMMISDWSGAALDYAFGLRKPVIFFDVPQKIQNPQYHEMEMPAFEDQIRERIGVRIDPSEISTLPEIIEGLYATEITDEEIHSHVFNFGCAGRVGANEILKVLDRVNANGQ